VLTGSSSAGSAKDLDLLIRYLAPVFLSQNFAAVCQTLDPNLLSQLPGGYGAVSQFSTEMKFEIADGLSPDELRFVVLSAAKTAQVRAREAIKLLNPDYPRRNPAIERPWCEKEAMPLVAAVLKKDVDEHDKLMQIIKKAKE
jgi:hypothetical protein